MLEAIHSAASGLRNVEAISQETIHDFDVVCLLSVEEGLNYESNRLIRGGNV